HRDRVQRPGRDRVRPLSGAQGFAPEPDRSAAVRMMLATILLLQTRILTLADALHTAETHHPALRAARAATAVSEARADELYAPLLPQVTGTTYYRRATGNFVPQPGQLPITIMERTARASAETFNVFNLNANATQLLWDFGQARGRWQAGQTRASAQVETERASRQQVVLGVRTAY